MNILAAERRGITNQQGWRIFDISSARYFLGVAFATPLSIVLASMSSHRRPTGDSLILKAHRLGYHQKFTFIDFTPGKILPGNPEVKEHYSTINITKLALMENGLLSLQKKYHSAPRGRVLTQNSNKKMRRRRVVRKQMPSH